LGIVPLGIGTVQLSNIVHIEIEQGNLDQARKHLTELRSKEKNVGPNSFTQVLNGRVALLEDNPKSAIRHINKAIRISRDLGQTTEIGERALLGEAYLANDNPTAALKATTRAVKELRKMNFPFIDDHPHQNIWWRHVQALRANKKNKEADALVNEAIDEAMKGA